jgi:aminopeptidase-like protein
MAVLWVLSLSDGEHDLVSIARRSGLDWSAVLEAADRLVAAGLLDPIDL